MKTFWFQIIGLGLFILVATFLAFNYQYLKPLTSQLVQTNKPQSSGQLQTARVLRITDSAGNTKVQLDVEIADTKEKRAKGLGYRSSLASSSGMFFIHETTAKHTYWMKGMEIPIDMIWILDDQIVDIIDKVPPPLPGQTDETLEHYAPVESVNRVLETNAGFVEANNIVKGDKIILDN